MYLPLTLLWKLQIDLRRKLGIGALFSLTFFTMAVSIARCAVVTRAAGIPDKSMITLWSQLEHTVAITIACLVSYRAWFTRTRPQRINDGPNVQCRGIGPHHSNEMSHTLGTLKKSATVTVVSAPNLDGDDDGADSGGRAPRTPMPKEYV